MILRDAAQSCLDDVVVACETAAERYHDSARRLTDPDWARLFAVRGAQLERMAAQLGADLRTLDDLPSDPDPEREVLHGFAERLRTALSGDPRGAVVEQRRSDERELLETVERARSEDLPQAVRAHLQRVAELARHMLGQLEALQHGGPSRQ